MKDKDHMVRIGVIGSENVFKISDKYLPSLRFSNSFCSRIQKILKDLTGIEYRYDENLESETDILIINIVTGLKNWYIVKGAIR